MQVGPLGRMHSCGWRHGILRPRRIRVSSRRQDGGCPRSPKSCLSMFVEDVLERSTNKDVQSCVLSLSPTMSFNQRCTCHKCKRNKPGIIVGWPINNGVSLRGRTISVTELELLPHQVGNSLPERQVLKPSEPGCLICRLSENRWSKAVFRQ